MDSRLIIIEEYNLGQIAKEIGNNAEHYIDDRNSQSDIDKGIARAVEYELSKYIYKNR